mgnify:FL=1
MTTTITPRAIAIQAEQWDGSDRSLAAIQQLIFPASPLVGRRETAVSDDPAHRHLAVSCDRQTPSSPYLKQELKHAKLGDWVAKWPDGAIDIVSADLFRAMFDVSGSTGVEQFAKESLGDA